MSKIPKIIHYVWVGGGEKPQFMLDCIESWKKFCPDYEIKEWNDIHFEQIKNKFSTQAYEAKKWAFVSDYIRLYALLNEGGFYLDTDIELTKNIDEFLEYDFASCFENYKGKFSPINTAFMGAKPNCTIIKDVMMHYETREFITPGGFDMTPNPKIFTGYFESKFDVPTPYKKDQKFELMENCVIFPSNYFCAPKKGEINYAIHHFDGSWLDEFKIKEVKLPFNLKFKLIKARKEGMKKPQLNNGEKELLYLMLTKRKALCIVQEL